jgi:hypothetical protein
MIFDILITFGAQNNEIDVNFERSLKSLVTQKNSNWNLVVIGDTEQIETAKNIVQKFKQSQGITNKIDLVQVKTYGSIDINQAFEYFEIKNQEIHKLLMLESGDYFSPEFLTKAQDFLESLDLSKNSLESYLAFSDFKYLNSKNQAFESTFVLKTDLEQAQAGDFIFRPKLLLHPIQFFWDLSLIKKLDLKFDNTLENQDLKSAKFNLDYILAIAQLNNYLLPVPKFCSKAYYISSNPVIETLYDYSPVGWIQILKEKEEILQKIDTQIWWKYKWLKFWKR